MFDVRGAFFQELSAGKRLVLMPVSRFTIEKPFRIDQFAFYPAGSVEFGVLRTVPGHTLDLSEAGTIQSLNGQPLREVQSSLTGASIEFLSRHVIVAFPYDLGWEQFLNADHIYDITLLRHLSEYADQAMDIIKLHFCTFERALCDPGRGRHVGRIRRVPVRLALPPAGLRKLPRRWAGSRFSHRGRAWAGIGRRAMLQPDEPAGGRRSR
jgi:hypothetical protein